MTTDDISMGKILLEFSFKLRPLVCIAIPQQREDAVLITVSERNSERYVSMVMQSARLTDPIARDVLVAEIKLAFKASGNVFNGYREDNE